MYINSKETDFYYHNVLLNFFVTLTHGLTDQLRNLLMGLLTFCDNWYAFSL